MAAAPADQNMSFGAVLALTDQATPKTAAPWPVPTRSTIVADNTAQAVTSLAPCGVAAPTADADELLCHSRYTDLYDIDATTE